MWKSFHVACWSLLIIGWHHVPVWAEDEQGPTWNELHAHAIVHYQQGRYDAGLPVAQDALTLAERSLGARSLQTAQSSELLGRFYAATGRYAKALHFSQRALALFEYLLRPTDPRLAHALIMLAQIYVANGEPDRAIPLYERALAIQQAAYGPHDPHVLMLLMILAEFSLSQGQPAIAVSFCERALTIQEAVFGCTDPMIAQTLIMLAKCSLVQGNVEEAESFAQQALNVQERALGPNHPEAATTRNLITRISAAPPPAVPGASVAAEPKHPVGTAPQVLSAKRRVIDNEVTERRPSAVRPHRPAGAAESAGSQQPMQALVSSMTERAVAYLGVGDYDKAHALFREALAITERLNGPDHPSVADVLEPYAIVLRKLGHANEAEAMETRAKRLRAMRQ